jgi:hypothetical protein
MTLPFIIRLLVHLKLERKDSKIDGSAIQLYKNNRNGKGIYTVA